MIRYVFKDEPLAILNAKDADPQVIGESLAEIAAENKGRLMPLAVVEKAKAKNHPLHKHFEWDDQVAAMAHRMEQARRLIRIVVIEVDDSPPTRAFLSVNDRDGVSYRTVDEVRNNLDLQLLVLERAEKDLEAFEKRYKDLSEICDIVREARKKVAARKQEHEQRAN